jgi:hypothetical protein
VLVILLINTLHAKENIVPKNELRTTVCINGEWDFTTDNKVWPKTKIRVPSPWNINSFTGGPGGNHRLFPSYPKEWEGADAGWYKRQLSVPDSWSGKKIFIRFNAASYYTEVYMNGAKAGSHETGFTPFSIDVTPHVKFGQDNEILVSVTGWTKFMVNGKFPFPTGSFWGMHVKGIWQDVFVDVVPVVRIEDVYITTSVREKKIRAQLTLTNNSDKPCEVVINNRVTDWTKKPGNPGPARKQFSQTNVSLEPNSTKVVIVEEPWLKPILWGPDDPHLYVLTSNILINTKPADEVNTRFGFREFWIEDNKFLLNGIPINLRGDSWHYMGYSQQNKQYAELWYDMDKKTNINVVRLHAQVYPEFYLEAADEKGMLITDETAIWGSHLANYYGDRFMACATQHITELVKRDRNHPSVVIWSVENECLAAHNFGGIKSNNGADTQEDLAKLLSGLVDVITNLDPTRPVSADGDGDLGDKLPIFSIHYAGYTVGDELLNKNKPLNIGEGGSMYYSVPSELACLGGDKVYESFNDRMETIGKYELAYLVQYERQWANQIGLFNTVWYCLEPLPFKERKLVYKDLSVPGVKPEIIGTYTVTLNPGYDDSLPKWNPNPAYKYMQESLIPIRFFYDQQDTTFYAGTVKRSFTIHNDSMQKQKLDFVWDVAGKTKPVAKGIIPVTIEPSEYKIITVKIPFPKISQPLAVEFNAKLTKNNKVLFREPRKWTVYPDSIPAGLNKDAGQIGIFKGSNNLKSAVLSMGITPVELDIDGPISYDKINVVLVDLYEVAVSSGQLNRIYDAVNTVNRPLKVIVFASPANMKNIFGQSVNTQPSKDNPVFTGKYGMFPLEPAIVDGLEEDDLKFWPPDRTVIDYLIKQPYPGNVKPLLVDGDGESACLAVYRGNGLILLNTINLAEKQAMVPAAKVLIKNMVRYAADYKPVINTKAGLIADAVSNLSKMLRMFGVDYVEATSAETIADCGLLIIDGTGLLGNIDMNIVKEKIKSGMKVLLCNVTPETVAEYSKLVDAKLNLVPTQREEQIRVNKRSSLINGLTNNDLFWIMPGVKTPIMNFGVDVANIKTADVVTQTPKTDWRSWCWQGENFKTAAVLRSERERPEKINGLVTVNSGQGQVIIDQLLVLPLHEKSRKIFGQMLTNLGVKLSDQLNQDLMEAALDDNGYIRNWNFIGPITSTTTDVPHELNKEFETKQWSELRVKSDSPVIDFRDSKVVSNMPEKSCVYIAGYIYSVKAADALLESPEEIVSDLVISNNGG